MPSETTTSPQNTQKQNLKRFHNNRQRSFTTEPRSTSHLYQRSITQQKHWQSQNPFSIQQTSQTSHTTRRTTYLYPSTQGGTFFTWSLKTRQLTLHTFLISIYNISVILVFTPFKLQSNQIFRSPSSKKYNRKKVFTHHKVSSS